MKEVLSPTFNGKSNSFAEFVDDFTRVADYNSWDSEAVRIPQYVCVAES